MFANKPIAIISLMCALVMTGCAFEAAPTVLPAPTSVLVRPGLTPEVFTGIPPVSNPRVQADGESMEEFVARNLVRDVSYHLPVLIARSELEEKDNLYFGIPSTKQDVQQCWFYEVDSNRECTTEDLDNSFRDASVPKIFFAFAYSTSTEWLILVEYFYPGDRQYPTDYYRLILELKDGKWSKKSILPMFW